MNFYNSNAMSNQKTGKILYGAQEKSPKKTGFSLRV